MTNYSTYLKALDAKFHLHSQTDAIIHQTKGPLILTEGQGVFVKDVDGNTYLEAMSSLWYANLGFDNPRLIEAAHDQLRLLSTYHTFNHRSNEPCTKLAEQLSQIVPLPDARIFYVNSGSEAIDTMIKAAWYYHVAAGYPSRRKIISRQGAFHGSSVFGAVLSGLTHMKTGFNLPADDTVIHVGRPCMFRDAKDGETEQEYCDRMIAEVIDVIDLNGAENIAAMIAEPIMGAAGVLIPPLGYFERLSELLKSHGILLLMDEVICGFGRTGQWFGSQTLGATPDMISMAKGLTSGYIPMGAIAIAGPVFDMIASHTKSLGVLGHGFTYSGHPTASAVALAALEQYHEMDVTALTVARGSELGTKLSEWDDEPIVGDIRINGFVAGIELVADRATRQPFPQELLVGKRFEANALKSGLIVRSMGDTIAICPPYIINDEEMNLIFKGLRGALTDTQKELADIN